MITALAFAAALQQAFGVTGLRVEHLTNPLGIDVGRPRLSWRITSAERNTVQAAYQLQVTRNERLIWDTGRTSGDSSVFVVYAGPDLESRRRHAGRTRVWDGKGHVSDALTSVSSHELAGAIADSVPGHAREDALRVERRDAAVEIHVALQHNGSRHGVREHPPAVRPGDHGLSGALEHQVQHGDDRQSRGGWSPRCTIIGRVEGAEICADVQLAAPR